MIHGNERNITEGALYWDPDEEVFVEVTDLASAIDADGVTVVERGYTSVDDDDIMKGARILGYGEQETPPPRPEPRPTDWSPRELNWPPPREGHIFWVPKQALVHEYLRAWHAYLEAKKEGWVFETMDPWIREGVLGAGECAFAAFGIRDLYDQIVVMDRRMTGARKESIAKQWRSTADNIKVITAKDGEKAVWKILRGFGIERHKAA